MDQNTILLFRMVERLTLSAVIVLGVLVVMAGFWKGMTRLDLSSDKLGIGGSALLATPVLMVALLVGYAWVSLSAPLTLDAEGKFIGASAGSAPMRPAPLNATPGGADTSGLVLNDTRLMIGSLNCLASDNPSADPGLLENFARAKLALLQRVWAPGWGDPEAFARAVELDLDPGSFAEAYGEFTRTEYRCDTVLHP